MEAVRVGIRESDKIKEIPPIVKLSKMVLKLAFKDLKSTSDSARKSAEFFLLEDNIGFPFYCDILGVCPDAVRDSLKEYVREFK